MKIVTTDALTGDRQYSTDLDPNASAPNLDYQLSFLARGIIFENSTGQWWYVPSANRFIPPYTVGIAVKLIAGTSKAEIRAQDPPGFTSAPLANERARVTFLETLPDTSPGYSIAPFTAPFSVVLQGALINRSGTITTGGVSQQLMAANISRRYLFVQNLSTGWLYIRPGGAANAGQPSIALAPAPAANQGGGSFVMEGTAVDNGSWEIFGATTGAAFSAYEM